MVFCITVLVLTNCARLARGAALDASKQAKRATSSQSGITKKMFICVCVTVIVTKALTGLNKIWHTGSIEQNLERVC